MDNDGYNPSDDKYTILCTTRKTYNIPKKTTDWPTCVKSCPRQLTYLPLQKTGLIRTEAPNTVPAGQYGQYVCADTSLGVDRVSYDQITQPRASVWVLWNIYENLFVVYMLLNFFCLERKYFDRFETIWQLLNILFSNYCIRIVTYHLFCTDKIV